MFHSPRSVESAARNPEIKSLLLNASALASDADVFSVSLDSLYSVNPANVIAIYRYARKKRDFDLLSDVSDRLIRLNDSILGSGLDQNFTQIVTDQSVMNMRLHQLEVRNAKLQKWLYVTVALIILAIIIIILPCKILHLKRVNRAKDKVISESESIIEEQKETISKAQSKFVQSAKDKYRLLDLFCEKYYMCQTNPKSDGILAKEFTKIIDTYSIGSAGLAEVIKGFEEINHELYGKFVEEISNLKDEDKILFLYSGYGMSSSSLAVLTKNNMVGSVYSRKKRLKGKIRLSDSPNIQKFLDILK